MLFFETMAILLSMFILESYIYSFQSIFFHIEILYNSYVYCVDQLLPKTMC